MSYPIQSFFDYDFEEPNDPSLGKIHFPNNYVCPQMCDNHQLLYHPLSDDVATGQLGVLVSQGHLRHVPVDQNMAENLGLCFGLFPIPGKCETKVLGMEPLTDTTTTPQDATPSEPPESIVSMDSVSSRTRNAATRGRKHKVTIKVEDTEEKPPRGLSPASTVRVRVPPMGHKSRAEELEEQSNYGWDGVSRGVSRMEATAIMEARQEENQRERSRQTGAGSFTNSEASKKQDDGGVRKEPEDHRSAVERWTRVGQVKPGKWRRKYNVHI